MCMPARLAAAPVYCRNHTSTSCCGEYVVRYWGLFVTINSGWCLAVRKLVWPDGGTWSECEASDWLIVPFQGSEKGACLAVIDGNCAILSAASNFRSIQAAGYAEHKLLLLELILALQSEQLHVVQQLLLTFTYLERAGAEAA